MNFRRIESKHIRFLCLVLISTSIGLLWPACSSKKQIRGLNQSIIKISQFNARGDGRSDDGPAIKAALDYARKRADHCIIEFDNATYLVKQQINLPSNITLKGNKKTRIKAFCHDRHFTLFSTELKQDLKNINIQNIKFQGCSSKYNLIAFGLKNFSKPNNTFENIHFSNCDFESFSYALIINNTQNLSVVNCTFKNTVHCFSSLDNHDVKLSQNTLIGVCNGFVFIDDEQYANSKVNISENSVRKITNYPIHFSDKYAPYHEEIVIDNNFILGDTTPYEGMLIGGSADQISVYGSTGVAISNNRSYAGGDMGITVYRSKNVDISGNDCAYNDRAGIAITGDNNNIQIYKNTLYNNGQRKDKKPVNAGITLYSNDKIINRKISIKENIFYDDQSKKTQLNSIHLDGTNNEMSKQKNRFTKSKQ